jgi:hypothetical protein
MTVAWNVPPGKRKLNHGAAALWRYFQQIFGGDEAAMKVHGDGRHGAEIVKADGRPRRPGQKRREGN